MKLATIDYVIMLVYLAFVLGIGFALKRLMKSSMDFFLSGRSIPAWITGLAFISANLGAQEVIGMGASGAKYGIATSHFYWIGAIPAMIFVGIFMMPFYYGSRARSVPEYLKLRFDEKTRGFNAISFAVMTICSSGISMMVMGKLFNLLLGWDMDISIWVSAIIVLFYISLGGLTSAIYNEVLQFFLIVFGFLPLTLLGLKSVGGWSGLKVKLAESVVQMNAQNGTHFAPNAMTSSWQHMGHAADNPIGVEWFGLAMGLGFVLSFGYWCTDFLVVQRAMAADSMSAARRTPLIAAIPKMLFPFLVIIPGMVALVASSNLTQRAPEQTEVVADNPIADRMDMGHKGIIPVEVKTTVIGDTTIVEPKLDKNGKPIYDYNLATPMMLINYFPSGLLGVGLAALLASFMSGMAGNVTAFNTVWTCDIYQSYINKHASDAHYLWMGRFTTVWGTLLSVAAAYAAMKFNNIMDVLQLVFGYVNAPLFATFFLGMFWRRTTGHGAFLGLLSGTLAAFIHHGLTIPLGADSLVKGGFLGHVVHTYPSEMAQNFWMAIWAFSACFVITIVVSLATKARAAGELQGLVYSLTPKPKEHGVPWYKQPAALAVIVLALTVALNFVFF